MGADCGCTFEKRSVSIKMDVRQGRVLSAKLIDVYSEKIFRESDELPGCVVGGENVNNPRYADDTVLIAESEKELQALVNKMREESEKKGDKNECEEDANHISKSGKRCAISN